MGTITGTPGDDTLSGGAGNDSIAGSGGRDTLAGRAGADTLDGGDADDVLTGGRGNDVLIAGAGEDTAQFAGAMSGYRFGFDPAMRLRVTDSRPGDGDGGSDTLDGVETLAFADGRVRLHAYREVAVNSTTVNNQYGAVITTLADGSYVIAWQSQNEDGSAYAIVTQRYAADGNPLGGEHHAGSGALGQVPALAALADGGYVLAWTEMSADGSSAAIFVQRFHADGSAVDLPARVDTAEGHLNVYADVAVLADGGFVIGWRTHEGAESEAFARCFGADGAPQGEVFRINSSTGYKASEPSVAALEGGGFVFVWTASGLDGSGSGVFMQRHAADGTPVGSETRVNTTTPGDQAFPEVTGLADGGYVVVWSSGDGSAYGVVAQRFAADGRALGSETRVNTTTAGPQYEPVVTALAGGGYVIAWQSEGQDGSGSGVYARVYDAQGWPVGNEFRVNTTTVDYQGSPVVSALADGGFVISWVSNRQDGSELGVYAQRFTAEGRTSVLTGDDGANAIAWSGAAPIALEGLAGADTLAGGEGADALDGGKGADMLRGREGDDVLLGGGGSDTLAGGAGDDVFYGGAGSDLLSGGAGADSFRFDLPPGAGNADRVTDFTTGVDQIVLAGSVFTRLAAGMDEGNLAFGSAAQDADDYLVYDSASGALYYDADGSGALAAIRFARLAPGLGLTIDDFRIA